jgi:hypothetical protein
VIVTAAETRSAVIEVATVAMAVADNNQNCRDRQKSTKCGSSVSGDSGCGSINCGSAAATIDRDSGAAEVTTIKVAATANTVVVNLYPLFPLAMTR